MTATTDSANTPSGIDDMTAYDQNNVGFIGRLEGT
jgi:hypothetical protein